MICPKCGFEQPEDIYCAFCGVNIEKFADQRKKKRIKGAMLASVIILAAISGAVWFVSSRRAGVPERMAGDGYDEGLAEQNRESNARWDLRETAASRRGSRDETNRETVTRSRRERDQINGRAREYEEDMDRPLTPSAAGDHAEQEEEGLRTARDWLEKGRALDDDSDAEIECYETAINLDPEFAPAYYRLGAIYYRQAKYELADQQFANFVKYATEEDWEAYDIYVYYSLADVDRLSGEIEEEAALEKAQEVTSGEIEAQAEAEPDAEAEKRDMEKAREPRSDDVMTIVQFSPVDGHVMVPVVLNDTLQATVMVDTGAGITILSRELARDLGLTQQAAHPITLKTIAKDVDGHMVMLDSIQIGDLRRDRFPVAITDLALGEKGRFHGILGMDFMNDYIIEIDNERRSLALTPKAQ
jgi:predicted aspartyl protease